MADSNHTARLMVALFSLLAIFLFRFIVTRQSRAAISKKFVFIIHISYNAVQR